FGGHVLRRAHDGSGFGRPVGVELLGQAEVGHFGGVQRERGAHAPGSPHTAFSFRQVLAAFATSRPSASRTSHSTYPSVEPAFTTVASAVNMPCRTARRKLILSSTVVKLSPSPSVAA